MKVSLCSRFGFAKLVRPKTDFGTLRFDDEASGDCLLDKSFLALPALFRAAVLQEAIGLLEHEYNQALDDVRADGGELAAKARASCG